MPLPPALCRTARPRLCIGVATEPATLQHGRASVRCAAELIECFGRMGRNAYRFDLLSDDPTAAFTSQADLSQATALPGGPRRKQTHTQASSAEANTHTSQQSGNKTTSSIQFAPTGSPLPPAQPKAGSAVGFGPRFAARGRVQCGRLIEDAPCRMMDA